MAGKWEMTAGRLCGPPIVYDGDVNDPKYHSVLLNIRRRVGKKCYLDGVDVNLEAYEAYEGENGWVNCYLKERLPGGQRRIIRHNGIYTVSGYRGKVEFK